MSCDEKALKLNELYLKLETLEFGTLAWEDTMHEIYLLQD